MEINEIAAKNTDQNETASNRECLIRTIKTISYTYNRNGMVVPVMAVSARDGKVRGGSINQTGSMACSRMVISHPHKLTNGSIATNFTMSSASVGVLPEKDIELIIAPKFEDDFIRCFEDKPGLFEINPLHVLDEEEGSETGVFEISDENTRVCGSFSGRQKIDTLIASAFCLSSDRASLSVVNQGLLIRQSYDQDLKSAADSVLVHSGSIKQDTRSAAACGRGLTGSREAVNTLISLGIKSIASIDDGDWDEDLKEYCKDRGVILFIFQPKSSALPAI